MKKFLFLMLIPTMVAAQQTINGLNIKGKLDVISTTKSSNPCPSMTEAQRDLITVPAIGSCVYNTNALSLNIYDGAEWKSAGGGSISLWLTLTNYKIDDVVIDSNKIYKSLSDHTSGVFATDLANGEWVELSASEIVDLTTDVTGVLPIANGGTGTSIKNFVDLASSQSVGGNKSFQNGVAVQGDLLTYGAVQTTLNEGMVSTDAAGKLIKGVLRPEIDLENQRLGFNYGGDDNLIPNGSFENTIAEDNWNCSSGVGTVGESNVSVADGVKSFKVGLGTGASYCYQDNIVIPSANVGKEHIYSITASSDRMLDFCAVGSSLDQNCVRYTPGNGPQLLTTFYTPTTTTGNGLIIKSVNLLAGDMYIDKASMKVVTPSESSKSISNLNSLTDPSFEKGLVDGWQLSGVGNLTTSATEVLDLPRNKKALMVDSSTTTNVLTASWSTVIPPAGVSGVCSGWIKTPNALTAEVVSNSTRIASKAIEGTNVWQYFEMYFKTNGTHTPTCRFLNATSTIYHLDEMFFGLKESPINITSFKNDGSWIDLGETSWFATTTNPTKGTRSRDKVWGKRNGTNLDIRVEYYTSGTGGNVGSGVYSLGLPSSFQGQAITIDSNKVLVGTIPTTITATSSVVGGKVGDALSAYGDGANIVASVQVVSLNRVAFKGIASATNAANPFWFSNALPLFTYSSGVFVANFSIPIAEWVENTNAAIVACKEGPLKCNDSLRASISTTGAVTNENVDWISGNCVQSGNQKTCTINSALGLTQPLFCPSITGVGAGGRIATLVSSTSSQVVFATDPSNYDINVECFKTGADIKNPNEKVLGFTEDADIRSTEWLTGGYDYISGKPIYKRCHRVASDITGSSQALVTWPSLLLPVGIIKTTNTDDWLIESVNETAKNFKLYYFRSTGALNVVLGGGTLYIGAGTTICMNYIKP